MEPCFYGAGCTRPGCIYRHDTASGDSPAKKPSSLEPCMPFLAGLCAFPASGCRHRHPGNAEAERLIAKYKRIKCRHGEHCKTRGCLYVHPNDPEAKQLGREEPSHLEFPPLPTNPPAPTQPALAPNSAWRVAPVRQNPVPQQPPPPPDAIKLHAPPDSQTMPPPYYENGATAGGSTASAFSGPLMSPWYAAPPHSVPPPPQQPGFDYGYPNHMNHNSIPPQHAWGMEQQQHPGVYAYPPSNQNHHHHHPYPAMFVSPASQSPTNEESCDDSIMGSHPDAAGSGGVPPLLNIHAKEFVPGQ